MSSTDDHGNFRKRVPLLDAGLLTAEEEASLEAHVRECAPCREVLDVLAAEDPAGGESPGHIPGALLARWDRVAQSIHGLERELLARHLAGCETCREELEVIGQNPALEVDPGVEPSGEEAVSREKPPRVLRLDPGLRRRAWFQGAAVGAVLAAASVLVILQPPSPGPEPAALPWVAPGTTRGSAREVAVSPKDRKLLLALENPGLSRDTEARLVVTDPSGQGILDRVIASELLENPTVMVVLSVSSAFEPGIYEATWTAETLEEPLTSSFRVTISGR